MKKKLLALIVAAMAAAMTAPALVITASAAPDNIEEEAETTDVADDEEKPATTRAQTTTAFDADEFLSTYTTGTTYDYYSDPMYDTDGNASLISNKQVIYSSAQLQFLSVTTKDGHVFYIIIDYTDTDGDNVYFLNKVDDFDLYRLLYTKNTDEENDNVVEQYEAKVGTSLAPPSGQQQGTTQAAAAQITDAAAQQPGGGMSVETMMYLIGGGIFAIVMAVVVIVKMHSIKKNRIPTDDFGDEDEDEDIGGEVEIR